MREISIQRTTTAILRDAFRVDTQLPNAETAESGAAIDQPRFPYALYDEPSRTTVFSRYDLRKMTEGARL